MATADEIAREAGKPKVSGTGRMGAPHNDDCTCQQCTHRKIAQIEAFAKITEALRVNAIKEALQTMISSAEVFVDSDDTITGYKVKTGALHRLFGLFVQWGEPLNVPSCLPMALDNEKR
jgi:hypothetical protein